MVSKKFTVLKNQPKNSHFKCDFIQLISGNTFRPPSVTLFALTWGPFFNIFQTLLYNWICGNCEPEVVLQNFGKLQIAFTFSQHLTSLIPIHLRYHLIRFCQNMHLFRLFVDGKKWGLFRGIYFCQRKVENGVERITSDPLFSFF